MKVGRLLLWNYWWCWNTSLKLKLPCSLASFFLTLMFEIHMVALLFYWPANKYFFTSLRSNLDQEWCFPNQTATKSFPGPRLEHRGQHCPWLIFCSIAVDVFAWIAADRPFAFGAPFNCRFIEVCSGWEGWDRPSDHWDYDDVHEKNNNSYTEYNDYAYV